MNAPIRKKTRRIAVSLLILAAGAPAGGCAGAFSPKTDQTSPLAPRIADLVDANRRYPRWEDFPKAPEGLPKPARIAADVRALEGRGSGLQGETARIDWTLGDPEALAAEARAQVGDVPVSPDSARTAEEIEAFARQLRDRAKAPPPIDRRPAQ